MPTAKLAGFLSIFYVLNWGICAQTNLTSTEIKTFKAEVAHKSTQLKSLKGNFNQYTQISMLSADNLTKGTFWYKAPNRLKWSYEGEGQHSFIFKDDNDKIIVKSEGKSHTVDLSANKTFKKLSQLISQSLNGKILEDPDFKMIFSRQGNFYVAQLVPKEAAMREFYSQLKLTFTKATFLIDSVILKEPSGDRTKIVFKQLVANENIPDSVFN